MEELKPDYMNDAAGERLNIPEFPGAQMLDRLVRAFIINIILKSM